MTPSLDDDVLAHSPRIEAPSHAQLGAAAHPSPARVGASSTSDSHHHQDLAGHLPRQQQDIAAGQEVERQQQQKQQQHLGSSHSGQQQQRRLQEVVSSGGQHDDQRVDGVGQQTAPTSIESQEIELLHQQEGVRVLARNIQKRKQLLLRSQREARRQQALKRQEAFKQEQARKREQERRRQQALQRQRVYIARQQEESFAAACLDATISAEVECRRREEEAAAANLLALGVAAPHPSANGVAGTATSGEGSDAQEAGMEGAGAQTGSNKLDYEAAKEAPASEADVGGGSLDLQEHEEVVYQHNDDMQIDEVDYGQEPDDDESTYATPPLHLKPKTPTPRTPSPRTPSPRTPSPPSSSSRGSSTSPHTPSTASTSSHQPTTPPRKLLLLHRGPSIRTPLHRSPTLDDVPLGGRQLSQPYRPLAAGFYSTGRPRAAVTYGRNPAAKASNTPKYLKGKKGKAGQKERGDGEEEA